MYGGVGGTDLMGCIQPAKMSYFLRLLPHLWWKKHPGWVSHETVLLLSPEMLLLLLLLLLLSPEIVLLLMDFCLKPAHLIVDVSPVHRKLNSEIQRD